MDHLSVFRRWIFLAVLVLSGLASAQCNAPELVKGADKYNDLVCRAYAADDDNKGIKLLLAASQQPVLEAPNIRLFAKIARTYASLGRFNEADLYLKYDNLSLLWMIGIVRCQQEPGSQAETLMQDGELLTTDVAKHMTLVLCGPMFDEFSYFRDRDADSFVPAAKAILRHEVVRKEIDFLRQKQHH
jgi:hypothetical protein